MDALGPHLSVNRIDVQNKFGRTVHFMDSLDDLDHKIKRGGLNIQS